MAVKADLGSGLTEIVIKVVILIADAIKIVGELIVLIQDKVSKLEVSKLEVSRLEVSRLEVSRLEVSRVAIIAKRVKSKTG